MQRRPIKKLPLDLPKPRVRGVDSGYRRRVTSDYDEIDKTASLFRRILTITIIIIAILVLKNVETEFTQDVVEYVRTGITEEFKMDEVLGKLKFVNRFFPDIKTVFGEQSGLEKEEVGSTDNIEPFFAIPAEGKVSSLFGDNNQGIDILGNENNNIYAVADGEVMAVSEDDNGKVALRIDHDNHILSQYKGCSTTLVSIGDKVNKGDKIGTMGENPSGEYLLRFEAWIGDKPVDPLKLIETGK